jgi:hypothetical protein
LKVSFFIVATVVVPIKVVVVVIVSVKVVVVLGVGSRKYRSDKCWFLDKAIFSHWWNRGSSASGFGFSQIL